MSLSDKSSVKIYTDVETTYPDYLRDESRSVGRCESLVFPESEADIQEALLYARQQNLVVTIQGARTGITAGAVPAAGLIVNLSRMKGIIGLSCDAESGCMKIVVQPGLTLAELNEHIQHKDFDIATWDKASQEALAAFQKAGPFFFSPDPTEQTAAIGGMVSCNASGARSYKYGATRGHVCQIRLLTIDGDVLVLKRDVEKADGRSFCIVSENGREFCGVLPSYTSPVIKSAAGYCIHQDMDLIDLFIGAEGSLGIITEITLKLLPAPGAVWGVMAFFPSENEAITFVDEMRKAEGSSPAKPTAIEFFDHNALALLRRQRIHNAGFSGLPEIPDEYHTAIYVEHDGPDEDQVAERVEGMCDLLNRCGGNEETTWIATDHHELQRLKDFRHAIPESVNMLIDERRRDDSSLTKLGTDMAVADEHLSTVMCMYHTSLAEVGLEYVIFGHIGDNHVHVNILPRNHAEYEKGKALYMTWAEKIVALKGTVSAEHGIGKLKVPFLQLMYGEKGIDEMKAVKRVFDPQGRLNPGNLFAL